MTRDLTPTEHAEALSRAVALVTARRGGMPTEDFARLCAESLLDLRAVAGEGVTVKSIAVMTGQLAAMAAHACDQWDKHAPDERPADDWLTRIGTHAAERATP